MSDMADAVPPRKCPGCAAAMRRQPFGRKPAGSVDVDLCFDCQAIWFDSYESAQLTPGSVLQLFREIESQAPATPKPLAAVLRCVTCRERLAFTHDIERTNAFVYYRCPEGHGRFTTFLQFLREKEFVRSLSPLGSAQARRHGRAGALLELRARRWTSRATPSAPTAMLRSRSSTPKR